MVIVDGNVAPGMEVMIGPGLGRPCGYERCTHRLHPDDPPSKRYHHPKCRTADWKARKATQTVSGVVAVRSLGPSPGDAQNVSTGSQTARAKELRRARAAGTVANDLRVQYSRAVQVLAEYLRLLNVDSPERTAHRVMAAALPERRRG